jgi:gliding motility-associated-like protein
LQTVNISTQDCDCLAFIPNAFTPNGDDRNDIYKIEPRCITANFSISIYNRFGERVFQSQSPDNGWNGLYNGQRCEVGTYFFFLHFRGPRGNDIEKKGDLMLIR